MQSLVGMNEAASELWHVAFVVLDGLLPILEFVLPEESLALSVALSFWSVFILFFGCQCMKMSALGRRRDTMNQHVFLSSQQRNQLHPLPQLPAPK